MGGDATSKLTRINQSVGLDDPVPQRSDGNGGWVGGSSTFDKYMPWSGMTKRTINGTKGECVVVDIPKFWYKWTPDSVGNGITLQISNEPVDGFYVSYPMSIGRYLCGSSYLSQSGVMPVTSVSGSTMQSKIASNGITNARAMIFSSFLAIQMLYLVEYADFNSQNCIGYGCSSSGSIEQTGGTDSMTYHTGTNTESIDAYGVTQYRHIEGLWNNVSQYIDDISMENRIYKHGAIQLFACPSSNGVASKLSVTEYSYTQHQGQFVAPSETVPSTNNMDSYICDQFIITGSADSNSRMAVGGRAYNSKLNGISRVAKGSYTDAYSDVGCRMIII